MQFIRGWEIIIGMWDSLRCSRWSTDLLPLPLLLHACGGRRGRLLDRPNATGDLNLRLILDFAGCWIKGMLSWQKKFYPYISHQIYEHIFKKLNVV